MFAIFGIVGRLRRRREAVRSQREAAEAEARALLASGSRREALRILRDEEARADPDRRMRIDVVQKAVFRLAIDPPKADVATRLHYGDR